MNVQGYSDYLWKLYLFECQPGKKNSILRTVYGIWADHFSAIIIKHSSSLYYVCGCEVCSKIAGSGLKLTIAPH